MPRVSTVDVFAVSAPADYRAPPERVPSQRPDLEPVLRGCCRPEGGAAHPCAIHSRQPDRVSCAPQRRLYPAVCPCDGRASACAFFGRDAACSGLAARGFGCIVCHQPRHSQSVRGQLSMCGKLRVESGPAPSQVPLSVYPSAGVGSHAQSLSPHPSAPIAMRTAGIGLVIPGGPGP